MEASKTCSACKKSLPSEAFYPNARAPWCKPCRVEYTRGWRARNRERSRRVSCEYAKKRRVEKPHVVRAADRRNRRATRADALAAYGGKCACCGESEPNFLGIDHVFGGGAKHRKIVGARICYWLKKNGYPAGFRILCHNCNLARGFYGICPHETAAYDIPLAVRMEV